MITDSRRFRLLDRRDDVGGNFTAVLAFGGNEGVVKLEDILLRDGLDLGHFNLIAVEVVLLRYDLAPVNGESYLKKLKVA